MFTQLKNFFDLNQRRVNSYRPLVARINAFEKDISALSNQDLAAKTTYFKSLLSSGKKTDDILPEAFAVIREAIKRTTSERAFDVQLMAAIALHQGAIAEQKTGEGKTHSAVIAAYLNALTGQGVHIVTPNDYLTRVGAGWYPKALNFLGISTAAIIHEQQFILDPSYSDPSETIDDRLAHLRPITRTDAYLADVTYGTNNEFGFDYLRDHLAQSAKDIVQRPHHYAIVDEVDFVLIDEARTPLIISSANNQPTDKYYRFSKIASDLQPTDYIIDEKSRSATLSEYGIRKVERVLGVKNLYEESFETIHYIENAIKALAIFHKDKDYVIKDGQIIIVDEFTGRLMYGRRWSDGLHQAVEAKEGVTVQQESRTWATITFQNYFRLYQKLAGMTGTAATESEEFHKIYNLDVITIPTHRPIKRLDSQDLIFKTQHAKYAAIADKVQQLHRQGQPVLIGTTSIEKNQIVSSLLTKKGIPHQILNAKNHKTEAEIIAQAGQKGAITVATNMAGRGVDIILGGSKDKMDADKWEDLHQQVVNFGGLYVIGTERHDSRRIDNQLRGRSGRQGDPGQSEFYVALDDDLMRIFGGDKIASLMSRFNLPEDTPLTHPLVSKSLEQIQVKVEGYNFEVRKNLVEYDDVINKQRQIVYKLREQALQSTLVDFNHDEVFRHLRTQLENIYHSSLDPLTQQADLSKFTLEFAEILPMEENLRTQLLSSLATVPSVIDHTYSLLENSWNNRVKFFGPDLANDILRFVIVSTLDQLWVDHLTALDDLRDGVRLRGYAQKDPLIEYRKEGYEMFQKLMSQYEYNLARRLFRVQVEGLENQPPPSVIETRGSEISDNPTPAITVTNQNHPNRNDPCPCGSGKKYKKCCYPKFG